MIMYATMVRPLVRDLLFLRTPSSPKTNAIMPAQFYVYNAALRRFPKEVYDQLKDADNLFTTTIFVLVSAVQKLARVMKLPQGLRLFRGTGGRMALPDHFCKADPRGCKGYVEWGFMSTTANR
jgi:hypothetical protein